MEKLYLRKNVWEATQERLDFIFSEFDHIYVSLSGGKDSGLVLHLVIKYMQDHGIKKKIGLFHQDFEAQYEKTTEFVTRCFDNYADYIEPYWVCLPMAAGMAASTRQIFWYPWERGKEDVWVRPMPDKDYVINWDNNPFDFYEENMLEEELYHKFSKWYRDSHGGKVCCLLGLRADESLRRYSAIINKKHAYKGEMWISQTYKDAYSASPIYDWTVEDVWTANGKYGFDYNRIYDLYYKAGLTVNQMRVSSPFHGAAVASLNLYRVLEPQTWVKLLARVDGANFGAIYGGTRAMAAKSITLPEGHTWESYTKFLLSTLPRDLREQYLKKFNFSMEFWKTKGGGFKPDVIQDIRDHGYTIHENGLSSYGSGKLTRITFDEIPDQTDDVTTTKDIPSWKRMCICILKNDPLCKYMGFGPTKEYQIRINAIKNKYKSVIHGGGL